jgi:Flp pilus assembly protein TadG
MIGTFFQRSTDGVRSDGQHGAAMVELAITLNVFLALFIMVVDITRLSYSAVSMQYLISKSARWGVIGRTEEDPASPGVQLSRADSIKKKMIEYAGTLSLQLDPANVKVCPATTPACTADNAGGPNDFIVISVTKPVKVFFGTWSYNLSASVFAKNEPYV